jgi:hypothetical protein
MEYMKYIQKKLGMILFGLSTIAITIAQAEEVANGQNVKPQMNDIGQEVWRSKTEQDVLKKETKDYNVSKFKSRLSALGLHEWYNLTPEQRKQAMQIANSTNLSPDAAVFRIDPNF